MRASIAVLLLILSLSWQIPASVLDTALERASAGNVRLADTRGTLWQGSGFVIVNDPVSHVWQPWVGVEWRADPMRLWHGALAINVESGGYSLAHVEIAPGGIRVKQLMLRGPARFFLERIPSALGRLGWRGDMAVDASTWACSWSSVCVGQATMRWLGAATDLLEGRPLGDYEVIFVGDDDDIRAHWQTLHGEIMTTGDANWRNGGVLTLSGKLSGDATLLQRLPNIANRWVRPSSEPGIWLVSNP